jgi:hypothetical protein
MRKLLTLFATVLIATVAFGQRVITNPSLTKSYQALPESRLHEAATSSSRTSSGTSVPFGSVRGTAVTAVKVAEASNAFTSLVNETNQVPSIPSMGNGGVVAFLNRQNVQDCGGVTNDNGRFRYSISVDGGATWNIGGNGGTYVPPAFNGCYGIGTVNPAYTRPSRYPNAALFVEGGSTSMDSIGLAYSGPVLQPGGSGWDGYVTGVVTNAADSANAINVTEELYQQQAGNQYFNYSMVTQVDSRNGDINFWFGSRSWDGTNVGNTFFLNKGTYNSSTNTVSWSIAQTINLPYYTGFDGNPRASSFVIGFSPNGQHGWIGMVGDLIGGTDTVYNPILIHSDDYGDTWGNPQEIDINAFIDLQDTLINGAPPAIFVDSLGNPVDTTSFSLGKATTSFDCDLEVDVNGNPHMLVVVGNASSVTTPEPGYSIFSGLGLWVFDVTKDAFGDWNMAFVSKQATFRGEFGDTGTGGSSAFTADPYLQVTRSDDGTMVFYSWTDTDTTGIGGTDNNSPNLIGRSWDLTADKMTSIVNWTSNDLDWASRAILPKTSTSALQAGTVFKVPTVVLSLDNNDAIQPVSMWYFQDVQYDRDSDFTIDPTFFYNCKENPFTNAATPTDASCAANNDGAVTLAAGGGIAPYSFSWSTGDTTANISGLAAGVYSVVVSDDKSCNDTIQVIINNTGAPTAAIDPAAATNPSCFGLTDGSATVNTTGGSGGNTFAWSNGETTATATMLPAGQSTVTVTDMSGCQSFATVSLTQPRAIIVETDGTDLLCNGDASGAVEVSFLTGGAGGFSFSWDDPNSSTTAQVTGLSGGTYTVTVTDMNGCTETADITINEPPVLTEVSTKTDPAVCGVDFSGTATSTGSGGTAPYDYNWSNGSTGSFIFGLDCGCLTVEITDANGCTVTSDTLLLGPVDPVTCMPIQGSIADELSAGISTWNMFPNPANGQVNIEVELANSDLVNLQMVDLHGRTVLSRSFGQSLNVNATLDLNELTAGMYLVKLQTSQGEATRRLVIK